MRPPARSRYRYGARTPVARGAAERAPRPRALDPRGRHLRHSAPERRGAGRPGGQGDRKSTRLNSSHRTISYAVFCLKKKKKKTNNIKQQIKKKKTTTT